MAHTNPVPLLYCIGNLVIFQNGGYQFSESASVVSHVPSMALDSASAYQSYGQEEGDTGGVTTGFEGLR